MKRFALFLPNSEQAQIVEGSNATVKRKLNGLLRVVIVQNGKRIVFNDVVIFCEVSKQIEIE
jgi:hypothetical protein